MFKFLFFIILITSTFICNGQIIYEGNSEYSEYIKCNIVGDKIYKNNSSFSEDVIFTIQNNKIYRGASYSSQDVILTIQNNKIYRGNSSMSSDIIANIRPWSDLGSNIKIKGSCIYKGNSSYSSDIIATSTTDNGRVYEGFVLYNTNPKFRSSETLSIPQLVCILYYLNVLK